MTEIRLRDPLSEVTRAERRTLLGVSAVGIVIAKSGLVPSKISTLGIEFDHADQRVLLRMTSAIVFYFLVAFLIYAASDLLAWRLSFYHALVDWRKSRSLATEEERQIERQIEREATYLWSFSRQVMFSLSTPISLIRAVFEFAIPIIIGIYTVVVLLRTPPPLAR